METIADRVFENEPVELDGMRYLNCRFVNCTLRYRGGTWSISNCKISGGDLALTMHADATLSFLRFFEANFPGTVVAMLADDKNRSIKAN